MGKGPPLSTPDGRYIVVRGRLWRKADPGLSEDRRTRYVADLMAARRGVRDAKEAGDDDRLVRARAEVQAAKLALGERGPTWWGDEEDLNRRLVANTRYAAWYAKHYPDD